jgi:VCBS repeat-containing protein
LNFVGPIDAKSLTDSPVSLGGEGFAFGAKPGFVQHHPSDAHIVVPDAHLLFSGTYVRIGNDLIISGSDQKFVVGNYFKGETRPSLSSTDGATLSGQIVDALTGHVHYAQANAPAAAAQVIGHVLKMSGSATAVRNGVSIELHIGDAVQKGDVIQTGSDSSIGMTFVDGSAFGMTSNARMVLNEMIYDPNGSSNSSLISLVQGTITFVAGQTAKNGNMRVETPVATMGIRGTAVLVEIAADNGPTKFSVLVEPDGHTGSYNLYDKTSGQLIGTVSQAGQVTFVSVGGIGQPPTAIEQLKTLQDQQQEKALIQQVFQLYFPNYNPDNSNPKSQKFGSTSYNNLAEITFTTTTNQQHTFLTQIELRFAVIDPVTGVTTYQNRIFYNTKAVFSADSVFGNQSIVPITETFKFQDVVHIDDPDIGNAPFYDIGVPFVAGSAVILSAISTISNVSEAFLKSLIHIDQTTGQVTFDRQKFNFLDDGQTVTIKIQVTATSGPDTGLVIIPITITGANDAPTIVGGASTIITGDVKEDVAVASGHIATNGTITFQDFDLTDAHTASAALTSTASTLLGFVNNTTKIGTFTIDPVSENLTDIDDHGSVGWHFTLDDNDPILQSLAEGQTIKQTYTITITDDNGVPVTQTVTITITGTNDAPVLTADASTHNTVEIPDTTGDLTVDRAIGTLTFVDLDLADTHQATTSLHHNTDNSLSVTWSGGSYSSIPQATRDALASAMTALVSEDNTDTSNQGAVSWKFELPDHLLDFLADGETLTIVYDVTITDNNGASSTQQVTILIGAANDQPVISAIDASGAVTEDVAAQSGILHDTGSVTFTDADLTDTHTAHVTYTGETHSSGVTVSQDLALALKNALSVPSSVLAAGDDDFHWSFDLDNCLVQYLAAGETVTATYTITVTDGSQADNAVSVAKTVTVTITGTNDAPVITADTSGTAGTNVHDLTESNSGLSTSGTLAVTDVDITNTVSASVFCVAISGTGAACLPSSLDAASLKAMFSVDSSDVIDNTNTTGTIHWTFNSAGESFDFLAQGETLILTYTVRATDSDSSHATSDQTIVIQITGTNDVPAVTAALSDEKNEGDVSFEKDLLSGASDADHGETATLSVVAASLSYTVNHAAASPVIPSGLVLAADGHTLTIDPNSAAFDHLAVGQSTTIVVDYDIKDVHDAIVHQTETITIHGTNDAPTVSAALLDALNEGDSVFQRDLLTNASDVDDGETATLAVVANSVTYKVGTAAASSTIPDGLVLASDGHTLTIDPNSTAFDHLALGQSTTIVVSYDITDVHNAIVHQTETITINGTNDAPVVVADTPVHLVEATSTDAGTSCAVATLTLSDVDGTAGYDADALDADGWIENQDHTYSKAGTYGTATLDTVTNKLTYVLDNNLADSLTASDHPTELFTIPVKDDFGATASVDVTFTIDGANDAPIIETSNVSLTNNQDGTTTVFGLSVSDVDGGGGQFTVTAITDGHGTISPAGGADTVSAINSALQTGVVYTPTDMSTTGKITMTITDEHLASDTVNFIFKQYGSGGVELTSTADKDVLIGGMGADQFIFNASFGHDTIVGFDLDHDVIKIDDVVQTISDLIDHAVAANGTDTLITPDAGHPADTILLKGVAYSQLLAHGGII